MDVALRERVGAIVRNALEDQFHGSLTFDPVAVVEHQDEYSKLDGDYMAIIMVYDGDRKLLDPAWTSTFALDIRPQLVAAGAHHTIIPTFIQKSDWIDAYNAYRRFYPELDVDTP